MPNGTEDERRRLANFPGQQGILERAYTGARDLLTPELSPEAARLSRQVTAGPDIGQRAARAADVGLARGVGAIVEGAEALGLEAPSPAEVGRRFAGALESNFERLRNLVPTSPEAQALIERRRAAPVTPPQRAQAAPRPEATAPPPPTPTRGEAEPLSREAVAGRLAPAPAPAPAAAPGEIDPTAVAAGLQDPGYPQIWNGRQLILVGAPPELQARVTAAGAELERQRDLASLGRAAEAAAFTATNPRATPEEQAAAARTLSSLAPNISAPSPEAERQGTAFSARVGALRSAAEKAFKAASSPDLLPEEQARQAQLAEDLMGQLTRLSGGADQPAALAPRAAATGVVPEPWRGQTGATALATQRRSAAALDEISAEGINQAVVDKYFSAENDESRYLFSQLNSDQRRRILELRK